MVKIIFEKLGIRPITYVGYINFTPILHVEEGNTSQVFISIRLISASPYGNEICKALLNYGGYIYDLSNGAIINISGSFTKCNRIILPSPAVIYLTGHGEYTIKLECGYYSNSHRIVTDSRTITVRYDYAISPSRPITSPSIVQKPSVAPHHAEHRETTWKMIALITVPVIGGLLLYYFLRKRGH